MLRFKCLVLDHDNTVVQSEKTVSYPCFVETMQKFRPDVKLSYETFVQDCHTMGFYDLCCKKYSFTKEEMDIEYRDWKEYIQKHIPLPYPGISQIIEKHKAMGGIICVVSQSSSQIIIRDYQTHFSFVPDAVFGCEYPLHQQKPNPYPLLAIMEQFHLTADDLLVLDDSKLGYDMAVSAGAPSAFAAWGKAGFANIIEELSSVCDHTFHTTAEFESFLFDGLDNSDIINP